MHLVYLDSQDKRGVQQHQDAPPQRECEFYFRFCPLHHLSSTFAPVESNVNVCPSQRRQY